MKKYFLFLTLVMLATTEASALNRRILQHESFSTTNNMVKVAFFDADSTLRVSLSGSVSANGPKDVMILPFVSQRIAELNKRGYLIMIVSNQGGVGKGILPIETADLALNYMSELIQIQNNRALVHYIDFAEAEDEFRKPNTAMSRNLENELGVLGLKIDWKNSFMVGDSAYKKGDIRPDGKAGAHFSNSDRLFAENLKIPFFEPNDFFGWRCHGIDVFTDATQVEAYLKIHKKRCAINSIK